MAHARCPLSQGSQQFSSGQPPAAHLLRLNVCRCNEAPAEPLAGVPPLHFGAGRCGALPAHQPVKQRGGVLLLLRCVLLRRATGGGGSGSSGARSGPPSAPGGAPAQAAALRLLCCCCAALLGLPAWAWGLGLPRGSPNWGSWLCTAHGGSVAYYTPRSPGLTTDECKHAGRAQRRQRRRWPMQPSGPCDRSFDGSTTPQRLRLCAQTCERPRCLHVGPHTSACSQSPARSAWQHAAGCLISGSSRRLATAGAPSPQAPVPPLRRPPGSSVRPTRRFAAACVAAGAVWQLARGQGAIGATATSGSWTTKSCWGQARGPGGQACTCCAPLLCVEALLVQRPCLCRQRLGLNQSRMFPIPCRPGPYRAGAAGAAPGQQRGRPVCCRV